MPDVTVESSEEIEHHDIWDSHHTLFCSECLTTHRENCYDCGCRICGYVCDDCSYCRRDDFEERMPYSGGRRCSETKILGDTSTAEFLVLPRTIGVELELEHAEESSDHVRDLFEGTPEVVGIKGDGSLMSYPIGVELVTPPGYGKDQETIIRKMVRGAVSAGYDASSSAGLHVHVGLGSTSDAYENGELTNLYLFMVAAQKHLYHLQPDRMDLDWCNPLTGFYYIQNRWQRGSFDSMASLGRVERAAKDYDKQGRALPVSEGKYHIVNMPTGYGTAEFRLFGSTTDTDTILAWAGVCQAMVDYGMSERFSLEQVRAIYQEFNPVMGLKRIMDAVKVTSKTKKMMMKLAI